MSVKVAELMTESVIVAEPHHSIEHVRKMLEKNSISAVPVVNTDKHPVGIVSQTDLVQDLKPGAPISSVMTEKVYVVPKYEEVSIAARVMRNHHIHRVVVTHEKQVVGMVSSYDLLKLVEDHRFVMKNPPTPSKRKGSKRR